MPRTSAFLLLSALSAFTACGHESAIHGDVDAGGIANDPDFAASNIDFGGTGNVQPTSISIDPSPATIDVTVQDGVVTTTPLLFRALDQDGNVVIASWTIDRGELGILAAGTGTFSANGKNAGKAVVTATVDSVQSTANLVVNIKAIYAGANASSGTGPQAPTPAPAGGYNGVGGASLGAAPSAAVMTLIDGNTGTNAAFGWLYPYEGTVFPRGMLSPLLQWSVPGTFHATAVYIHVSQANYDFKGYYTGTELVNAPIDAAAWKLATNNNGGDPLTIEIKITDGTTVLGPIQRTLAIAPSRLRGSVYYNTYNSQLNPGGDADGNGGVLKINPGGFEPEMAVPSLKGTCHVCHEVSSDGSQLFVATSISSDIGKVFDLTQPDAVPVSYSNGTFTYGGVYPDGSMSLLSSKENYHAYNADTSLFTRNPVANMSPAGLSGVIKRAVTPSFSPDGRRTAFNFWEGTGANGVTAGNGRSIVAMDFECGAAPDSVTCGAGTPGFANLRELYRDTDNTHYVGWPSFTPDSKSVLFQRTVSKCTDGGSVLNTRNNAKAEMWISDVPDSGAQPRFAPMPLCRANGMDSTCTTSYLPTNAKHSVDQTLNFEPNVTPIASGGYYWVVFTSRRLYGNVATGDPYYPKQGDGTPTQPPTKKLWVAAIDPNPTPGKDPSHPAFYLPGQEINSGNMRGFWVREACQASGTSCETGDECCTGYCNDGNGSLTCGEKPVGCQPEFGKCGTDTDCCGSGQLVCIGGLCSNSTPPVL